MEMDIEQPAKETKINQTEIAFWLQHMNKGLLP